MKRIKYNLDLSRERVLVDCTEFKKCSLKKTETAESAFLAQETSKMVINHKIIKIKNKFQQAASFDHSKLKKVEVKNESNFLTKEKTILSAAAFDKSKLNHVKPVEKDTVTEVSDFLVSGLRYFFRQRQFCLSRNSIKTR